MEFLSWPYRVTKIFREINEWTVLEFKFLRNKFVKTFAATCTYFHSIVFTKNSALHLKTLFNIALCGNWKNLLSPKFFLLNQLSTYVHSNCFSNSVTFTNLLPKNVRVKFINCHKLSDEISIFNCNFFCENSIKSTLYQRISTLKSEFTK